MLRSELYGAFRWWPKSPTCYGLCALIYESLEPFGPGIKSIQNGQGLCCLLQEISFSYKTSLDLDLIKRVSLYLYILKKTD